MAQAWLQVIGLVVEFLGVLLLSWEWFTAQRQERAERALEASHARNEQALAQMQRHRTPDPGMQRHYEMSRDAQRRMTEIRVEDTRFVYGGMRSRAVTFALAFIAIGFIIQLLGAWPGCCRGLGIIPAG